MTEEVEARRSRTRGLLGIAALVLALGCSALLYAKSRSVDFDEHARVVAASGRVREQAEALSKQALAARFGLLNHYDPIVRAESGLTQAARELDQSLRRVVGSDPELSLELD